MTGAGAFANRDGQATDRPCAGDEHVFSDQIERERRVHGVPKRIETGKHLQRNGRIGVPAVLLRDRHEFRPSTGTINTDALSVRTKMPPSGEAITAMSAGDVTLGNDEIAAGERFYVLAHAINNAAKLMANDQRDRNRLSRPRLPIVQEQVRPTERST